MPLRPSRVFPRASLVYQAHGFGNLCRIRIASFYQAQWQAVRAEKQLNPRTILASGDHRAADEMPQTNANFWDAARKIQWVTEKRPNTMLRRPPWRISIPPPPFFHAAQRRCVR